MQPVRANLRGAYRNPQRDDRHIRTARPIRRFGNLHRRSTGEENQICGGAAVLRLTKQQRAYQEEVLKNYNLTDRFKPHALLVECMAMDITRAEESYRNELAA